MRNKENEGSEVFKISNLSDQQEKMHLLNYRNQSDNFIWDLERLSEFSMYFCEKKKVRVLLAN